MKKTSDFYSKITPKATKDDLSNPETPEILNGENKPITKKETKREPYSFYNFKK